MFNQFVRKSKYCVGALVIKRHCVWCI